MKVRRLRLHCETQTYLIPSVCVTYDTSQSKYYHMCNLLIDPPFTDWLVGSPPTDRLHLLRLPAAAAFSSHPPNHGIPPSHDHSHPSPLSALHSSRSKFVLLTTPLIHLLQESWLTSLHLTSSSHLAASSVTCFLAITPVVLQPLPPG